MSEAENPITGRYRATALRHAHDIQDRKSMQNRVADLVVEAFDLPQRPDSDPAHPHPSDTARFKQCLKLFQPSDFDDLVHERNVDERCGYALCPRPNVRVAGGGEKRWNGKAAKGFELVPRAELERWCSKQCGERALFVKAQLGQEPAWVRETPIDGIKLLDEVWQARNPNEFEMANSMRELTLEGESDAGEQISDLPEKMRALALERQELRVHESDMDRKVSIVEKPTVPLNPRAPNLRDPTKDLVEGHQPRKVRFADTDRADENMWE